MLFALQSVDMLDEILLHQRMVEQTGILQGLRQGLARRFWQGIAVAVVVAQAVVDDGGGHGLAAGAAHPPRFSCDGQRI